MNIIIELQLVVIAYMILWFDVFRMDTKIIKSLGFKPWIEKGKLPFKWRWLRCYFCTQFWAGFVTAIIYGLITKDIRTALMLVVLNIIVSKHLDIYLNRKK
jgi:hypothetical protein